MTLRNLILLKWTDDNGHVHKFELIKRISARWREIGLLLEITKNDLDGWEDEYRGNAVKCWYAVISEWLNSKPATWTDLFNVLEDIGCSNVCFDLENALTLASASFCIKALPIIPPPPPPPCNAPPLPLPVVTPPLFPAKSPFHHLSLYLPFSSWSNRLSYSLAHYHLLSANYRLIHPLHCLFRLSKCPPHSLGLSEPLYTEDLD